MDWNKELYSENEKPLDRIVNGISNTAIFRKIAFIGDSLSSGEFEIIGEDNEHKYYDMYEYSWGQYIARKNGIQAYSFSKGGMTAKKYVEGFAETNGFWDKEKACQAYVIALGVNDLKPDFPVGTKEDIDVTNYKNNKETFMGYYATIISRYKEIQPEAKFFLVTFPNFPGDEWDKTRLLNHITSMYALAEIFDNTYVIDLCKYGPYYDEKFREKFFLNWHMNASGYILTANIIDSYIDYIIRHNPTDFLNVPFIGTNINNGSLSIEE